MGPATTKLSLVQAGRFQLRFNIVFPHDLAPDADLFGEERLEILGVGQQQRHLLRFLQVRSHGGFA